MPDRALSSSTTRGRFHRRQRRSCMRQHLRKGRRRPCARRRCRAVACMNIFGGLDAWPVYVMRERGLRCSQPAGFTLALTATAGSVAQFQHVESRRCRALRSRRFRQRRGLRQKVARRSVGDGRPTSLRSSVWVPGFLALVTRPEFTAYEQLRGKAFAVDARRNGLLVRLTADARETRSCMPGDYTFVRARQYAAAFCGDCVRALRGRHGRRAVRRTLGRAAVRLPRAGAARSTCSATYQASGDDGRVAACGRNRNREAR